MLGSLFKPQFNIHKELERLHKDLRKLSGVKQVSESEGWLSVRESIIKRIKQYDRTIIGLSEDPVKNKDSIISCHSIRTALMILLGVFATSSERETALRQRINILEETARDIPPVQDTE